VEIPTKVYSDTKDKFVTWHFKSHNFTLMALWTKFLVEASEREINGTEVEMHDIHLDKLDVRLAANLREINVVGTLQQGYPLLLQQSRTRVVIRSCAGETE